MPQNWHDIWIICCPFVRLKVVQDEFIVKVSYDGEYICLLCQSSTVRRCPRGDTEPRLWRTHSEDSITLPQHDQCGLPGCPLWPCPQPWNPPKHTNSTKYYSGMTYICVDMVNLITNQIPLGLLVNSWNPCKFSNEK